MRKRLTVLTVGCKANFADSAAIACTAAAAGFRVVAPHESAEVIIVNGCAVTHRADRDSRALARRAKRRCPGATIVMTGCHAETAHDGKAGLPEAEHWIGLRDEGALRELLERLGSGGVSASLGDYGADLLLGHRRTFLKIQDGCDFACAYCIVPRARGRNRSSDRADIIRRAARAEEDGAREIVLTGIHIGLYGKDRGEESALPRLITGILAATSQARIRLSSLEPAEVTDRLLDVCAGNPRICPHLHVPLQSGSDRTLSRMGRLYNARRYAEAVERAAARMPGLQVGTDVIAGFPGETRADFEETVRFLDGLPVDYYHVFPYSPRAGTVSAGWPDDVSPSEKKERVDRLLARDGEKREAYLAMQVGRELDVLAETFRPAGNEISGYSANYVPVAFTGGGGIGEIVRVRAISVRRKEIAAARIETG